MDGGVLKGEPKEEPAGGVTSSYLNTARFIEVYGGKGLPLRPK